MNLALAFLLLPCLLLVVPVQVLDVCFLLLPCLLLVVPILYVVYVLHD